MWAHSANLEHARQSLRDHLVNTAVLTREFASSFGAGDAGWVVGLLHDVGKVDPAWQARLLRLEAGLKAPSVNHKNLGAQWCLAQGFHHGCLVVAGHHRGIPDWGQQPQGEANPALISLARDAVPELANLPPWESLVPHRWRSDNTLGEFAVRMLHSCLVDADYLDTAAHFAGTAVAVSDPGNMGELFERLVRARETYLAGRQLSSVDEQREELFRACLGRAEDQPGVFRISAPTGSGKTISAAAFALRHAACHGKRRVVVAVPFTTVTEQNAHVYRTLLGNQVVLEHHTAVEPDALAGRGVENWDAPFVVTTTVQLFESLFSNKPSKTRKLHRLARSVIVLDEVQAIPERLLVPVLDALKVLVEEFGVSVVMASATQPTWEALKPWRDAGLEPVEIVPDKRLLFASLRRVEYEWHGDLSLADVVDVALSERASLTVVNTTANARLVAEEMRRTSSESVLHLSTRMCRAHRASVLDEVTRRLAACDDVHLVSTQLVEAGVDLDFPLVVRQAAPAASLIQAAGRANREGRARRGRVVVVESPELASLQAYATGLQLTQSLFMADPARLDDPDAVAEYYRQLYALTSVDTMAKSIQTLRSQLAMEQVAKAFRMIDDDTLSVVIDWEGRVHQELLSRLSSRMREGRDVVPMPVLRSVQPYSVSLPGGLARSPDIAPMISEPVSGLRLWHGPYDMTMGIGCDQAMSYVF